MSTAQMACLWVKSNMPVIKSWWIHKRFILATMALMQACTLFERYCKGSTSLLTISSHAARHSLMSDTFWRHEYVLKIQDNSCRRASARYYDSDKAILIRLLDWSEVYFTVERANAAETVTTNSSRDFDMFLDNIFIRISPPKRLKSRLLFRRSRRATDCPKWHFTTHNRAYVARPDAGATAQAEETTDDRLCSDRRGSTKAQTDSFEFGNSTKNQLFISSHFRAPCNRNSLRFVLLMWFQ